MFNISFLCGLSNQRDLQRKEMEPLNQEYPLLPNQENIGKNTTNRGENMYDGYILTYLHTYLHTYGYLRLLTVTYILTVNYGYLRLHTYESEFMSNISKNRKHSLRTKVKSKELSA